jgi:hypothetical protein
MARRKQKPPCPPIDRFWTTSGDMFEAKHFDLSWPTERFPYFVATDFISRKQHCFPASAVTKITLFGVHDVNIFGEIIP